MAHGQDERRKFPRSRSGFPGVYHAASPGLFNHVDNISCNGVLCHTSRRVEEMTKMSITIELPPDGESLEAEGVVVRCAPHPRGAEDRFSVAILFTKLDDDTHHAIHAYVEHDLSLRGN